MAGLNSLMLGLGGVGLAGRAASMLPGMGGTAVPGPTSGMGGYMQRIGGAIPGQGAAMLGAGLLQQVFAKKTKKKQAGQVPTTPAAAVTGGDQAPASPATVGRGLAAKPSKAAYIGY
jgi:hypothetical protein